MNSSASNKPCQKYTRSLTNTPNHQFVHIYLYWRHSHAVAQCMPQSLSWPFLTSLGACSLSGAAGQYGLIQMLACQLP